VGVAWAARTLEELDSLLADLPSERERATHAASEPPPRADGLRHGR
jgi:hypothetical protein